MRKQWDSGDYLAAVCAQIRWKAARATVSRELEGHITDQADAYAADGLDREGALQKAVAQMGDPISTGQQLDRVHRPRPDWALLGIVALLVAMGAAAQCLVLSDYTGANLLLRYFLYLPVGVAALAAAYFADYSILANYPRALFFSYSAFCTVGALSATVVRGGIYFALPFLPLLAGIVYSKREARYGGLLACLGYYGLTLAICLAMGTIGGAVIVSVAYLIMMTAAICKGWFSCRKAPALVMLYVPVALAALGALNNAMVWNRLRYVITPQLDPLGWGYVGMTLRAILAGVKPWGAAALPEAWAGKSLEYFLPEWHNNFMLTYLMGRFGAVAGVALMAAALVLIVRLFVVVFRQKSALGYLVTLSVALAVTWQSVFYILGNFGLSVFGLSLPLLSYGGIGFVVNMALLGLALSAFRRNSIVRDGPLPVKNKWNRVVSLFHGRVVIDLRDRHTV